ncbi:hypothetical protein [Candidatus Laterigemmans baculatus]|uniref:hypothetical protein n=1 Tax=Candidatus Laterigemmans baculatus TaxID=2770505 RepID=UPI0013DAC7FD|nr:hypothetical protein [Candidatus Laterigemmans baculatus]
MQLRRKLSVGFLMAGIVALVWAAVVIAPFLVAMSRLADVQERIFMPFAELRAEFLHNGFGVFYLEFREHSLLSDDNVERLLLLNEMPPKYELTLMLETPGVTDKSIDTLAKLTTVDYLFVDKSGMTADGVAKLESLLPPGTVSHYTWEQDGG